MLKKFISVFFVILISLGLIDQATAVSVAGPLKVNLDLKISKALSGQNIDTGLMLKNTGLNPITLVHPETGEGMASFRVVRADTGEETLFQSRIASEIIPEMINLLPGETLSSTFSLSSRLKLYSPGRYFISAIYEWDEGRRRSESDPVRLLIQPIRSNRLMLETTAQSDLKGAFIDLAPDPPQAVIAFLEIKPGGGLVDLVPAGNAAIGVQPVLSQGPNGKWVDDLWIAWLQKGKLYFNHMNSEHRMNASRLSQWKLPCSDADIIPPLSVIPNRKAGVSGKGSALIWCRNLKKDGLVIRKIDLKFTGRTLKALEGETLRVPVTGQVWMVRQILSNGKELIPILHYRKNSLVLSIIEWNGKNEQKFIINRPGHWENEFVAAGAGLGHENQSFGSVLVWSNSGGEQTLDLIRWTYLPSSGVFKQDRDILPWSGFHRVEKALVRLRADGTPAVLLKSAGGVWQVWDSRRKKLLKVPKPYADTRRPIDIAFLNQDKVVLICADTDKGFVVKQMDGSDLPSPIF